MSRTIDRRTKDEAAVGNRTGPNRTGPAALLRRLIARLRRAAFYRELVAAGRIMKTEGVLRGLGDLIATRCGVIFGCARPANWKRLKPHEGLAALATARAAAFFLFYCAALVACSVATPILILSEHNALAVASGAFALYSLQGVPVMLGQTLACSAALPTPDMLAERETSRPVTPC